MTFIIAEAGVNHNGSLSEAYRLVEAAEAAGADAVKFQLFKSQKLWGDDRIKHLELTFDQMTDIANRCKAVGIEFMCTPFGVEELAFLKPMLKRIKIASGCINRKPLLAYAASTGLPVILSTGMSTTDEIWEALSRLPADTTLLHCTSSYPCKPEDANLNAILAMQMEFEKPIGYSDHTQGTVIACAAVALGAVVLEKHFTMNRAASGPDHISSIEPHDFQTMVLDIRTVEKALGDGVKRPLESELPLRKAWGRD